MLFGRFRECDIQIREQRASRRHFEVGVDEDGGLWIRDLDTVNGTNLNGKRIESKRIDLHHGDRISVGASHFIAQIPLEKEAGKRKQIPPKSSQRRNLRHWWARNPAAIA